MRLQAGQPALSATDLANHLACRQLTWLELSRVHGHLEGPFRNDPSLRALEERGRLHEEAYLVELRGNGRDVVALRKDDGNAADRTRDAMVRGADIIYQAGLSNGIWNGRSDFLVRV